MFRIIHPNRWFFWTISILIIAGIGLLFYIHLAVRELEEANLELTKPASENLSDPSYLGWKSFRSEVLGVSIKYPPHWQIEIDPEEANTVYLENPKNFNENVSISVVKPSLEKIIRQSLKIAEERAISVDLEKGVLIRGLDDKDRATSSVVLVKKGSKLYYIAGSAAAFEKIVAGIKFLN